MMIKQRISMYTRVNLKKRLSIYESLLSRFQKDDPDDEYLAGVNTFSGKPTKRFYGMCFVFNNLYDTYLNQDNLPELWLQKPKTMWRPPTNSRYWPNTFWWSPSRKENRIKALQKAIDLTLHNLANFKPQN